MAGFLIKFSNEKVKRVPLYVKLITDNSIHYYIRCRAFALTFSIGKGRKKYDEELDLWDWEELCGWKAQGKKITSDAIEEIELLEWYEEEAEPEGHFYQRVNFVGDELEVGACLQNVELAANGERLNQEALDEVVLPIPIIVRFLVHSSS
ncbi:MAG: hypothetical protein WD077_09100 [Bacteroidia bacterium]